MAFKGYHSNRDGVPRAGETVDALLTKIEDLEDATRYKGGTMSGRDKGKLDDIERIEESDIDIICI